MAFAPPQRPRLARSPTITVAKRVGTRHDRFRRPTPEFSGDPWDTATGKKPLEFKLKNIQSPRKFVFTGDRTRLIAGIFDGAICIVDAKNGKEIRRFRDGTIVTCSGIHHPSVRVWDVNTGAELHRFPVPPGPSPIRRCPIRSSPAIRFAGLWHSHQTVPCWRPRARKARSFFGICAQSVRKSNLVIDK
jgi:hypothetical protein